MLRDPDIEKLDPALRLDWHVVARTSDVPDNAVLGVKLLGIHLVLWRVNGKLAVAKNLCRHRGGSFYDLFGERRFTARIVNSNLQCPYHGWEYDQSGQCVTFPYNPNQTPPKEAQLLGGYGIDEAYGWVWVCLDPQREEIPPFAEWEDKAFRKIPCPPYPFRSTAYRFLENFLDVPHFPFVHEGMLGDPRHPELADYRVYTAEDGLHARDIVFYQPNPDGTGTGSHSKYHYQVFRPLTARFTKETGDGRYFVIFCHITPHDVRESTIWMCMAMNYGYDIPEAEIVDFQNKIAYQDIPIVESQRPELLPLDLTVELSMRADKASIEYRKWLKELGVTFGTVA